MCLGRWPGAGSRESQENPGDDGYASDKKSERKRLENPEKKTKFSKGQNCPLNFHGPDHTRPYISAVESGGGRAGGPEVQEIRDDINVGKVGRGRGENQKIFLGKEKETCIGRVEGKSTRTFGRREIRIVEASQSQGVQRGKQEQLQEEVKESNRPRDGQENFGRRGKSLENLCGDRTSFGQAGKCTEITRGVDIKSKEYKDSRWKLECTKNHRGRGLENCRRKGHSIEALNGNNETSLDKARAFGKGRKSLEDFRENNSSGSRRKEKTFEFLHKKEISYLLKSRKFEKDLENSICKKEALEWRKRRDLNDLRRNTKSLEILRKTSHGKIRRFERQEENFSVTKKHPAWERTNFINQRRKGRSLEALRVEANLTQTRKFEKTLDNCLSTKGLAGKSGKEDLDVSGRVKKQPEVAKEQEAEKFEGDRAKNQVEHTGGKTFDNSLRAEEENLGNLARRDKTVHGKRKIFGKPLISPLSTKELLDHREKGDLDKGNEEETWTRKSEKNTENSLDETAELKKQVKSPGGKFVENSLCRGAEYLENLDRENIAKNRKSFMVSSSSVKNSDFHQRTDFNELKRGTKTPEVGRRREDISLTEKPVKLSCLKIFNNSLDRKLINSLSTKEKVNLPNLKTETKCLNILSKKEDTCSDRTQSEKHLESSAVKTIDNRKLKKSLENLVKDNERSLINSLSVQVFPDQCVAEDLDNSKKATNFLRVEEKSETKKEPNLLGTKAFESTLRGRESCEEKFVKDDSRSLAKTRTLSKDVSCSEPEAVECRAEGPRRKGTELPSGMGMLLPDETYEERSASSCHENDLAFDLDEVEAAKALAALRKCDEFLKRHGIRPEFFCRHRERLALQAWLLQRSKATSDASSSNEAVHLQQRLRSLSTELVTLRNRLHVSQPSNAAATGGGGGGGGTGGTGLGTTGNGPLSKSPDKGAPSSPAPAVPPRTTLLPASAGPHALPHNASHTLTASAIVHPHGNHNNAIGHPVNPNNNLISDLDLPKRHSGIHDDGIVSCVTARGCPRSPAISSIVADVKGLKSPNGNQPHQQRYLPKAGGPNGVGPATSTALDDLIHLPGPLTEDAVLKCLQARFCAKQYHTNVGPILVCINPYTDIGNPLTLTSTRAVPLTPQLNKVVQEAVRQQSETGYPQAIILSGTSGSGKTYASMLLLRQLFDVAGGGPETDAFKHLAAAFTVLRSLGSAKTATNSESSRIGHFIEVQVTDGALYRTKIHCYFLDQTRVIRPLPDEKNYHIFYQMLAGLSHEERVKLNLEGFNVKNLRYLQHGDTRQDEAEDASRFQAWKACLGVLGIPFLDVVRVLAAVLILGNVGFADGPGVEVTVIGENELASVASLLGVPSSALLRGLTSRTHNARGQLVKSVCDANMSNMTRDSLAKALYCRTVATIVRRANSLKRLGSTLGTLSSDSNESVHNQAEVTSQHASTIGSSAGGTGSSSMAALNNAVRHATDGFIGILDMFGFEDPKPSQLEHLCINLCAETMQHFYNTHIFKSSIESCRDEGIRCDVEVDYVDNVPCIDLISSLRTGLLSMLDVECSIRGTAESYVSKVKVQHKQNPRLFEPRTVDCRSFGIQHFAGRVTYDASDFLDTNKDVVPDDLVAVFYKHTCSFGFATHLFGSELKALYASDTVPRGVSFRISPTSHTDLLNGDEPISTLTQDFHTRLDNLLRTLVHARPHFVRCIRSNATETPMHLDRAVTMRQIRSLQVLETVNLMAGGYPHRMRFKAFNARYRLIAPFKQLRRAEEQAVEDTKLILQNAQQLKSKLGASTSWALGKRHIFLSEGIRQQLENLRAETRRKAATVIQATWRGWRVRRRWPVRRTGLSVTGMISHKKPHHPSVQRNVTSGTGTGTGTRPRPQPIAGTPPPDPSEKCADQKMIQQTCTLFGLDLERPPPVPPSRSYTVTGNTKLGYPQTRVMKMPFPEEGEGEVVLLKGETVLVVGASPRRGHLLVEHNNTTLHVPYQFMELKPCNINV